MPSTREVEVFRERDRESPPRNRWDRERFDFYRAQPQTRERERDIDIRISESRSPPGAQAAVASPPPRGTDSRTIVEERDRSVREDSRGHFAERDHDRFYERDRYGADRYGPNARPYWEEPARSEVDRGALMPYRRPNEYERPARPGMIRRQSSLDTFDRRPMRYERDEWRPPSYVPYALPHRPRGYDPYYEDFRRRDRDLSPGWEEEYRDVRVRRKTRGGKHRRRRERERSVSVSSSSSSSSEDTKSVTTVKTSKTSKTNRTTDTAITSMLGKKGKTRMPKRLVHKQAIIDLGLPYGEEEHFIIVERALEKDHIDDVIKRSEGYRDTKVTYKFEEVNSGGFEEERAEERIDSRSVHESFNGDTHSRAGTMIAPPPPPPFLEIPPPPMSIPPPPRSIAPSHAPSHRSHRSRSRANSVRDDFYESRKTEIVESERASGFDRKSDRSIRDEIKALEAERESLRLERRADRKLLEAERRDDREEVVFVEKDRRGKMALVAKKI